MTSFQTPTCAHSPRTHVRAHTDSEVVCVWPHLPPVSWNWMSGCLHLVGGIVFCMRNQQVVFCCRWSSVPMWTYTAWWIHTGVVEVNKKYCIYVEKNRLDWQVDRQLLTKTACWQKQQYLEHSVSCKSTCHYLFCIQYSSSNNTTVQNHLWTCIKSPTH